PAAVLGKRATASCLANAIACSAGSNATRAETPTITMPTSPGSALTVITSYRCTLGCCAATRSNASCAVTPVAPPSTTNVCMAYTTPSTVLATAAPPPLRLQARLISYWHNLRQRAVLSPCNKHSAPHVPGRNVRGERVSHNHF